MTTGKERTYQIIIGVLVIVVVIGGWYAYGRKGAMLGSTSMNASSTESSSSTDMTNGGSKGSTAATIGSGMVVGSSSTASNTTPANGDAVTVSDQKAGMSVAVSSVSLSQAGWVAVRDSSGRTLGAAWFPAGTQHDVTVPLLRATMAGDTYQVLLYADNGDKLFDLHKDSLVTEADGSVAGTTFTAN